MVKALEYPGVGHVDNLMQAHSGNPDNSCGERTVPAPVRAAGG